MSRLAQQVNPLEAQAAKALLKVADVIQDCCYYSEEPIPAATVRVLHKAYRVLKPQVVTYYGEGNHVLVWDPPTYRFTKKESK